MKKSRPGPSSTPNACVTLNVDTAQRSGWCLSISGVYISSGEFDLLKHPNQPRAICDAALELGRANDLPVVMVYEKPFAGTSQGMYVGAWKMAWHQAGGVKTRFVGVYPATWRARVLGRGMSCAKRETVRPVEQRMGASIAGRPVGEDEAPAVCISRWSAWCGEVRTKLPGARKGAA